MMGKVTASYIRQDDDIERFVETLGVGDAGAIVKPNWTTWDHGFHTDAKTLDLLLSQIRGKKYVLESYMYARTDGSVAVTAENAKDHWDYLREQDAHFLEHTGMGDVLRRHGAEYINITEEWWSGRTVPSESIREIVEARHRPIAHREFYGMIPERLMPLRHLPLISYAKIKYTVPAVANFSTLSMKNMFGLIPVPNREAYHGAEFETGLSRSVVDILTVYASLFRVVGINEGVYQIAVTREDGKNTRKMRWTDYDLVEGAGVILGGGDLVTLDAVTNQLVGIDPETRTILKIGEEVFGTWDRDALRGTPDEMAAPFRLA